MAKIIDGKKLAEKIKDDVVKEIQKLPSHPGLAILLVGERPDSKSYVNLKEREGKKCGIDTHLYKFPENISEKEILNAIEFLNNDETIDGILLQLPLPKNFNTNKIVNAINPNKDVDGFHSENLKKINDKNNNYIMPPLAGVILEMLKEYNIDIKNKKIAFTAHSDIFMQGVGNILRKKGGDILPCNYDGLSENSLKECLKKGDIIITAIGKKNYLDSSYIKKGAVIIDIGIIKEEDKTYGDVNFEDVKNIASYITPVPGGVGPMTIACAFQNVLQLYKNHKVVKP